MASSKCPSFTGFDRVGRSWRSESTDLYESEFDATFSQESAVLAIEDFGDHDEVEVSVHTSVSGAIPQGNYTIEEQSTLRYRCDDAGLALLEEDTSSEFRLPNDTSVERDRKSYEPALLLLPPEVPAFTVWSGSAVVTHVHEADGITSTSTFEAVVDGSSYGQIDKTTPAGTFSAWLVSTSWGDGYTGTFWADGVGRIADEASHLVAYE